MSDACMMMGMAKTDKCYLQEMQDQDTFICREEKEKLNEI